jgi:hypothetical protein
MCFHPLLKPRYKSRFEPNSFEPAGSQEKLERGTGFEPATITLEE